MGPGQNRSVLLKACRKRSPAESSPALPLMMRHAYMTAAGLKAHETV
jgi:hypothetical protein